MSTNSAFREVVRLNPPGGGNWQCAAQNVHTGEWFVAHSRKRNDSGEDAILYRFDKTGKYLDQMTLRRCSHIFGFGVSDTNIIWLRWDDGQRGNDVVTLQYQPGESIDKSSTSEMHVFSDLPTDISFSPTRTWAVLRQGGEETYRLYTKQDILDGRDRPWGKTIKISKSSNRVVQGFSVVSKNLYVLIGLEPRSSFRIEKWSFKTGRKIGQIPVDRRLGWQPGMADRAEPEGMDGDTFGMKVGASGNRRMVVFQLVGF